MAVTRNCDKMGKAEDEGPLVPVKPPQAREISIFKGNCKRLELLELIDKRMGSKSGAGFHTHKQSRICCVCLGGGGGSVLHKMWLSNVSKQMQHVIFQHLRKTKISQQSFMTLLLVLQAFFFVRSPDQRRVEGG